MNASYAGFEESQRANISGDFSDYLSGYLEVEEDARRIAND